MSYTDNDFEINKLIANGFDFGDENAPHNNFFDDVKKDDLLKMSSAELTDKACCETKRLALALFHLCKLNQNEQFFNDPEVNNRLKFWNLKDEQMKPFNFTAILLMRKFKHDKDEDIIDNNNNDKSKTKQRDLG